MIRLPAAIMLASNLLPAAGPLVEGNPKSAVRVIAYEDLQCPDCATYRRMMDEQLLPKYGGTVAFEHREFPLAKHKWARAASVAARFFQEIRAELGVEFRRYCAASLKEITAETFSAKLADFAKTHGVEPAKAAAALNDSRLQADVEREYQEGIARGVARTPTVFVNGQPFIETFTAREVSQAIEQALSTSK